MRRRRRDSSVDDFHATEIRRGNSTKFDGAGVYCSPWSNSSGIPEPDELAYLRRTALLPPKTELWQRIMSMILWSLWDFLSSVPSLFALCGASICRSGSSGIVPRCIVHEFMVPCCAADLIWSSHVCVSVCEVVYVCANADVATSADYTTDTRVCRQFSLFARWEINPNCLGSQLRRGVTWRESSRYWTIRRN